MRLEWKTFISLYYNVYNTMQYVYYFSVRLPHTYNTTVYRYVILYGLQEKIKINEQDPSLIGF